MPREFFLETDNLPAVEAKLDAHVTLDNNLAAGVGLGDNVTSMGTIAANTADLATGDTVFQRLRKVQHLAETGGGASLALEDLGLNQRLSTITTTRRFTTYVNDVSVAAEYPIEDEGLWNVEVKVSSVLDGTGQAAGDLIDYLVTRHGDGDVARAFVSTKGGGQVSDWLPIGGTTANLLTLDNDGREHIATATNADTRNLRRAGYYRTTVNSRASAIAGNWPYAPIEDESIEWETQVSRLSSTTGRLSCRANYSDAGAPPSVHTWQADVVQFSPNFWTVPSWQYVGTTTPLNPDAGAPRQRSAVNELWIRIGQSNAVGVDHRKEDNVNQEPLEPFGADAPHPKVFDISKGPTFLPTPRGERNELLMMTRAADAGLNTTSFAQQFGKSRIEDHPEIEQLAIMCRAVGGSAMSSWKGPEGITPAGANYSATLADVLSFLRDHPEFTPMGIIWHQGESDVSRTLEDYRDDVILMVDGFRAAIPNGGNLAFIAGTMSKAWRETTTGSDTPEDKDRIHQAHLLTPTYITRSAVANFDDLIVIPNTEQFILDTPILGGLGNVNAPDIIHFGRTHLREMGRRYANMAEGIVDARKQLNMPRYQMQYDPSTKQFENVIQPGTGRIFEQRLVSDPDRGIVLDTATGLVEPGDPVWQGFYSDLTFTPKQYTKALWVRLKGVIGNSQNFLSHGANADDEAILMAVNYVGQGNASQNGTGWAGDIPADTWIHLALTFDGTNFQRYINGAEDGVAFLPEVLDPVFNQNTFGYVQVGQWERGAGQQWQGLIDSVYVSSLAMTVNEVAALYRNTLP